MNIRNSILAIFVGSLTMAGNLPAKADSHGDAIHQLEHLFEGAKVLKGPSLVDCKLSGGTETTCFSITVKAEPTTYTPGPWCPRNVKDGADVSGIWIENGEVHDADGKFMSELNVLYDDNKWQMVDPETGKINVTDTFEKCQAAARPDVGPEYENFCVECLPEYMPEDATLTYVIPIEPQASSDETNIQFTGSGVALNGVRLDAPAPVHAILGAYTIAPFDDCGGHVNIHVGYHYHAATDCLTNLEASDAGDGHAALIGLAMDGYKIYAHQLEDGSKPSDLDACYGHSVDGIGYHYHAGAEGSNQILGCLKAEAGCVSNDPDSACDATARPRRP